MKIRNGFVSNSSSSSFIVAFPREPSSVEEVKETLFPNGDETYSYYEYHCSTQEVSETVWKDIQGQKPNNKDKIWKELHGYLIDGPRIRWNEFKLPDGSYDWKAIDAEQCKYRQELMKKFLEENKDAVIYCFHYGDDNGEYEDALEHGGLFDHLPHIIASFH